MLLVAMVSISSQSSIYNSQKHKQIQITQVGHTKMYHAHFMMFNQHKIISFQKVSKNIVLNMKTGNLIWKVKWFRLQNAWNMVSIKFSTTFFTASLQNISNYGAQFGIQSKMYTPSTALNFLQAFHAKRASIGIYKSVITESCTTAYLMTPRLEGDNMFTKHLSIPCTSHMSLRKSTHQCIKTYLDFDKTC